MTNVEKTLEELLPTPETRAAYQAAMARTGSEHELRLYCLMRRDLEIPTGKMLAQAGHAFVSALEQAADREAVKTYFTNAQPKIVLAAKNLNVIERAARECRELGLNHFVVVDAGRTVFPEPTVTCMGIGPVRFVDLPKYVQKLQLF